MPASDESVPTDDPLPGVTIKQAFSDPPKPVPEQPMIQGKCAAIRAVLLRGMRSISGLAVLAVVPLLLVFANTQIKELADRFLGGCVLVIEKNLASTGHILVTGRIAGAMPKSIPLVFAGRDAYINTILFDEAYRQELIAEPDDLAFHPMTGQQCPGDLCREYADSRPLRPQALVILRDLRSEFTYRFRVGMQATPVGKAVDVRNLKVYALFDNGLADGVCRVQPRRWFNFWVWATPLQKVALFMSIVVAGGLLLKWAKLTGA